MHRFLLALTASTAVLTAGALMPSVASATPIGTPSSLRLTLDDMNPVQNGAICFYLDGWNGPGLYDCGYRHRRGQGWHGRRDQQHNEGRSDNRDRGRHDAPMTTEGRGRR